MKSYANAHALVSTHWVDEHKQDANPAIVEVDVDTGAYGEGHIPGALGWNWRTQLCDTVPERQQGSTREPPRQQEYFDQDGHHSLWGQ